MTLIKTGSACKGIQMDKKKIYEFVEAVDGGADIVSALKEHFKTGDNTEAELRTLKSKFDAVGDRDIARMVATHDLLLEKGIKDSDSLVDVIGKGEMSEQEIAKLKEEQNVKFDTLNSDYATREKAYLNTQMTDRITLDLIESCHGNSKVAESVAQLATQSGAVFRGEDGEIMLKSGSESLKFADSVTKLAEQYEYIIPKPVTGSGVDINLNNNNGSQSNVNPTWENATASV